MKDSHYRISLDIHSTQSQVSLPVKQGDTSRKVFISLCEGGKPYHIEEDCFAAFSAKKPDGTEILEDCIIADNTIEYEFTGNVTAASGMVNCEIRLYGVDRGLLTSPRFTVIVDARVIGDAGRSSSSYSALDTLVSETVVLKADMAELYSEVETKLENGEFDGKDGKDGEDVNYNLVSNALKGSASGTAVRIDDVSPVEHTMKVKVSDPSATLTKRGKNLFDKSSAKNGFWLDSSGGVETVGTAYYLVEFIPVLPNTAYHIGNRGSSRTKFYTKEKSPITNIFDTGSFAETFTTPSNCYYVSVTCKDECINELQLELGTTATEYEPYKGKTYPVNADGTVDNVTSLYPTTTLICNTEGVLIEAEYNRDANKVIGELLALIKNANRIAYIDLLSSKWQSTGSPNSYSQVVAINGVTENSFIDICYTLEQLEIFHAKDITFFAENDGGVVTVNCVGQKPTADYRLQVKITEVTTNE